MPLVSVIMPVYNGEKWLGEAIESILAQTFANFELLIVDDGSSDKSADIIRVYEQRDSRIRVFQLERNSGTAIARNYCIKASRGTYITYMDCDDISLPERLQKQVDFLNSNPQIGAVGTYASVVNEDLEFLRVRKPQKHHALILLDHYIGDPFVYASIMMRRELLFAAGLFDKSLRWAEDADLMTRLLGRTCLANIEGPLYVNRRHGDSHSVQPNFKRDQDAHLMRTRRLEHLLGEVPAATFARLYRVCCREKIGWLERRRAKRDIIWIIDSMIDAKWCESPDRPQLISLMNRRLESTTPRRWQQFCHWRRHRLGWLRL